MTNLVAEARIKTLAAQAHIVRLCEDLARFENLGATISPETGRAEFRFGAAQMIAESDALVLRVEASNEDSLLNLKSILAFRFEELAAEENPEIIWEGDGCDATVLPGLREMRVLASHDVTPHMRRITLRGEDLARFDSHSSHIALLIPPAGIAVPEWPLPGRNGRMLWPPEPRRPTSRVYTIRNIDAAAGIMDVDFVLHGDEGIASAWAMRAQPGDIVGILGPVGRQIPEADWYVLACDETGIPAIARILEKLPAGVRGHAFIEVADAAEEQRLRCNAAIETKWLHRNGAEAGTTTLLQDSVRATAWPSGGRVFAWVGAEGATARALRSYLREERGLDRSQHLGVAYWNRDSGAGEGMRGSKT